MLSLSASEALIWTARIAGAVTFLQTLELIALRRLFSDTGVWRWQILRQDYRSSPRPIAALLDFLLRYPSFLAILVARLFAALALVIGLSPWAIGWIFFSSVLISLRWRGSFNGGSDFMNLIVQSALTVAALAPDSPKVGLACLWYIAIQTCTSYFLAGAIKIRRTNWRSGRALSGFLENSIHKPDPLSLALIRSSSLSWIASWAVMIFECTFPLALVDPQVCLGMLAAGFLFHLGNVYFFGLNRFLLSWLSAYPALIFCSQFRAGL